MKRSLAPDYTSRFIKRVEMREHPDVVAKFRAELSKQNENTALNLALVLERCKRELPTAIASDTSALKDSLIRCNS